MKCRRHSLAIHFGVPTLCIATVMGCSAARPRVAQPAAANQTPAARPAQTTQAAPTEPAAPSCPRLPRAARTWTGFAIDVPSEAMHLALDVLVPIQDALGALFCGPERGPCRPSALRSVDLADASAQAARVEVEMAAGSAPGVLYLHEANGVWHADSESLATFIASCNARR